MTAISSLPNLGPAVESALNRVGIATAEDLRAIGADAAYALLLEHGTRPHFIGYYVIVLALQGRPFGDLGPEEKAALRQRFDAIKAGDGRGPGAELRDFMRDFGVLARR